jgi:hypothetical protein
MRISGVSSPGPALSILLFIFRFPFLALPFDPIITIAPQFKSQDISCVMMMLVNKGSAVDALEIWKPMYYASSHKVFNYMPDFSDRLKCPRTLMLQPSQ